MDYEVAIVASSASSESIVRVDRRITGFATLRDMLLDLLVAAADGYI